MGVEREINPGWQKKSEKCDYPKEIKIFSNLSLKFGDQNNLGPISKACHWINQGYFWGPREELLAPVLWRGVEHPQRWNCADWHIWGKKNPLTFMGERLMLQGTEYDCKGCLRVELFLPWVCPMVEVKLNLSQIFSLALWRSGLFESHLAPPLCAYKQRLSQTVKQSILERYGILP